MSAMSKPYPAKCGDVLSVRIRVVGRLHMWRPDKRLVALAVYARRYGIKLHAVNVMSTHIHMMCTDTRGQGPDFRRDLHRAIVNATKALRGWRGTLCDGPPGKVRLRTAGAVINAMGYVIANGVTSCAVEHANQWPGLLSKLTDIGRGGEVAPRIRLNDRLPRRIRGSA